MIPFLHTSSHTLLNTKQRHLSRIDVPIKAVGVFDTVGMYSGIDTQHQYFVNLTVRLSWYTSH